MWLVQVSKNRGSYTTRYSMESENLAWWYFHCINVHSGYNKRLVSPNGKVIERERTA